MSTHGLPPLPPDADLAITTERLSLEPLTVAHATDLHPVLADARLYEFTGGDVPTLDDLRARFRRWEVRRSPDGDQLWLNWTIRLRPDRVAVGYMQATVTATHADVAYVVGRRWSGRGIATEGLRAVCDTLRRLQVTVLEAHIHPDHQASMRVARKGGFMPTDDIDSDGERIWRSRQG
jgi:RimJ/RimL family protein N-acetyltransferase